MNLLMPYDITREVRLKLFAGDAALKKGAGFNTLYQVAPFLKWSYDTRSPQYPGILTLEPQLAHHMSINDYVNIVSRLKANVTHGNRFHIMVRNVIQEMGQDIEKTYFDLPRLRVSPPHDYLASGVSYAYPPHRDTWYAHPICAVNYWIPIFEITSENCLALFPNYFARAVENKSSEYDHDRWVSEYRFKAAEQTTKENRPHPVPTQPIDRAGELRVIGCPGDVLMFSAQHLHGTVKNTSGMTRFSIDFRTVNIDDLMEGRGAGNVDCGATGTTLGSYIRASDFAPLDLSKLDLSKLHPRIGE